MKKIRIIAGVFGWKHGAAYDLVKAGDPPIEVEDKVACRLVEQKVAEYVGAPAEEADLPDGVGTVPQYSINSTVAELREIARQNGLAFKVGMTKEEMVAALDAHIEANMVDGVDLDDVKGEKGETGDPAGPETEDEPDAEDAPSFDAAEAVQ